MTETKWVYSKVPISKVKSFLESGEEVEVLSPDGYVPVVDFVDKGMYDEYEVISLDGKHRVRCNCDHLFETPYTGWVSASQMYQASVDNSGWTPKILTAEGPKEVRIEYTGRQIPIVDITVDHENHRYYTDGLSSHNTGVGKTLFMAHCAAANMMAGMSVLYITLEMSEEKIAERIDANLLDLNVDDLRTIPKDAYDKRLDRVKNKTTGKLVIKEYPTASAGSTHFRHLVNELRLKKNFHPDIIYIDYLNICMSSRLRHGSNVNSYTMIKTIAEELRGLAVELNVPVCSATQTTRSGFGNSDVELTDTSESFGLPATADFMFALVSSEELESLGQLMVKQLKNRWGDTNYLKRFVIGIDRPKMRLYDAEQSAQDGLMDDRPAMDNGAIGERLRSEDKGFQARKKHSSKGFGDFK